jgi:hypothetical protein
VQSTRNRQYSGDLGLPARACHGERIVALVIQKAWVGTFLQKELAEVEVSPRCRQDQWRSSPLVSRIDIPAGAQMQSD